MNQSRLGRRESHAACVLTHEAEIRILIDRHGNQAGNLRDGFRPLGHRVGVRVVGPDLGVGRGKSGGALHGWEHDAADIRAGKRQQQVSRHLGKIHLSLNPKAPRTWLNVMSFENSQTFVKNGPPTYAKSL